MADTKISDSVIYIGADDHDIDLFESQYVVPNGVSYNSYVIIDEKIAVMDTADPRVTDVWFDNLEKALDGRKPDYLVVQHMEPDHAGNIKKLAEKYPEMKIVGNAKTLPMMKQFFTIDGLDDRSVVVKEGDTLSLGSHTLQFVMAPMVHWPEVMVTYEQSESCCSLLTDLESSAHLMLRRTGLARLEDTISTLWANTVHRYRRFLKRRLPLT